MFYQDDKGGIEMKSFLNRPKRYGWKSVRKADAPTKRRTAFTTVAKRTEPLAEQRVKRRTGMRVWADKRMELEPLRDQRVKGKGYLLAPSLVLWAAVWATREAYEFAMANMAAARAHDFKRI